MVAYGRRPKRNQRESAYVSRQRTWRTLPEPSSMKTDSKILAKEICSRESNSLALVFLASHKPYHIYPTYETRSYG